jgi:ketosteroid isomerase-like protein
MSIPRRFQLLVLPFLVSSCSERDFDSAAEQAKLLRRDAEWADLASAGQDVDKIVSYWSDDAALIFPGQPVLKGKVAIRAYVAPLHRQLKVGGCHRKMAAPFAYVFASTSDAK